jgi:hypothetical protein
MKPAPVSVGRTATHVWVVAGPWSVALEVDARGKFPETASVVPKAGTPATTLTLDPTDRIELLRILPALPGRADDERPVTMDLAGRGAVVRVAGEDGTRPTEIVLRRSRVSGPPVRVACEGRYLLDVLESGFVAVAVSAPDAPVVWRDAARTYLFMPLSVDLVVGPSPAGKPAGRGSPHVVAPRPLNRQPAQPSHRNRSAGPKPTATPTPPVSSAPGGLVEEAGAIRDALQGLLGRVRGLLGVARQQRQQERTVRSAMSSLKKLKGLAG